MRPFFCCLLLFRANIHRRIVGVVVFRIQIILYNTQCIAEPLEMHDLALAQEFERLSHIRVIDQAEQVVVGCAGFLLCYTSTRTIL